jgi:hypothetical protein
VFDEHSSVSVESTVMRTSFAQLRAPEGADDPRSAPQALARANAALRLLNEISIELLHDLDRERLVTLVMDKIFATLGPDRALLMLADEAGNLREETTRFGPGVPSSDFLLSSTLVSTVMEKKSGVLMIDALSREPLSIADSIKIQGVTSCLAAPLLVEDQKVLGLLYLDVRLGRKSFTPDDLRLASLIANTAAIKLENLRLQEGAAARAQMEREMSLAFEVQRRLLPEKAPTLANTSLRGHNIPSRRVSGDYYDFFSRRDGTWDAVVADVCGKGMAASILAASVQAAYHAWADENLPPDRLCERLNDFVYKRTSPEKFVTFIVAHYDPESGSLLYTNAGHNPGVLLRANGTHEELGAHGTPLGLLPNRTYGSGVYTMRPGDLLVLYTDGVTEACDPNDAGPGSSGSSRRSRPFAPGRSRRSRRSSATRSSTSREAHPSPTTAPWFSCGASPSPWRSPPRSPRRR